MLSSPELIFSGSQVGLKKPLHGREIHQACWLQPGLLATASEDTTLRLLRAGDGQNSEPEGSLVGKNMDFGRFLGFLFGLKHRDSGRFLFCFWLFVGLVVWVCLQGSFGQGC